MDVLDFHTYIQYPEKLDEHSLPFLKKLVEEYPAFQAAWILLLKNLKKLGDPDFDLYLKRGAIRISDRKKLYYYLMEPEVDIEGKQASNDMNELSRDYAPGVYRLSANKGNDDSLADLVKSIREKQPIEKENKQQTELANTPNDVDREFVTETLAKIYAKQGLYEESIRAYEKLSLKYPEKNVYFASRIEEIKKILN